MPITLNPSQLFVGADAPTKTNVSTADTRVSLRPPESRSDFDESLSRAKSKSAGAAGDNARTERATTDKKPAKASKSTRRRPQRTDDKAGKPLDEDGTAEAADATNDAKHGQADGVDASQTASDSADDAESGQHAASSAGDAKDATVTAATDPQNAVIAAAAASAEAAGVRGDLKNAKPTSDQSSTGAAAVITRDATKPAGDGVKRRPGATSKVGGKTAGPADADEAADASPVEDAVANATADNGQPDHEAAEQEHGSTPPDKHTAAVKALGLGDPPLASPVEQARPVTAQSSPTGISNAQAAAQELSADAAAADLDAQDFAPVSGPRLPSPASDLDSAATLASATQTAAASSVSSGASTHAVVGSISAAAAPAPAPAPEAQFAADNHPRILAGLNGQLLPNGGTMHLRLDPPELGALQVTVHMRDGVMTAAFQTSNDDATRLLSHSLSQLKHALEQSAGVSVEKIHVQQSPRDEHAANDDARQQPHSDDSSARQEQQRREMLRRMWRRLTDGSDPLDMVA